MVSTTLLRGNGTAEIQTDARGRSAGLKTVPWDNVTPRITDAGLLLFDYKPVPPSLPRRRFAREDLLLLRDRSVTGLLGTPRLQRASAAMAYAIQIQRTAQSFSANLSRPRGTLSMEGNMSEENAARLKADWQAAFGPRAERGKATVLSGGIGMEAAGGDERRRRSSSRRGSGRSATSRASSA